MAVSYSPIAPREQTPAAATQHRSILMTKPKRKAATAKKAAAKKPTAKKPTAKIAASRKPAAKKAVSKPHDNMRNVFLAGLGFYGKAIEEAEKQIKENRGKIEQRREKASELFDELVKRGEKVENDTRKKLKQIDLPELKLPELNLADHEELRGELRTRLDKARDSFNMLREAVSAKSDAA
jgi:polyhydroxyalkanoate synthesis regulator phasin